MKRPKACCQVSKSYLQVTVEHEEIDIIEQSKLCHLSFLTGENSRFISDKTIR